MSSQYEPLIQMTKLVEQLIDNAKGLNEVAKMAFVEEELTPLQEKQNELLVQLSEYDKKLLNSQSKDPAIRQIKNDLRLKLEQFQKLNNEFFVHVGSHFRLISQKGLGADVLKSLQEEIE